MSSLKLHLDVYISKYSGRIRLRRLLAIARSDSRWAAEALHVAVEDAKASLNTDEYIELVKALRVAAPDDSLANVDVEWLSDAEKKGRKEMDRLESELKLYKNNLIKESIRVCIPASPFTPIQPCLYLNMATRWEPRT
jgi:COP9 signalosome complex subunit 1